jgi:metal-responsive CopG/Arc/MetJ family transcriptional regulator
MATKHPRVQVTVDPELAEAMAAVDVHPKSRSRLIRDLAVRGAEAEVEEMQRREEAKQTLLKIVRGEIDYDFEALGEVLKERETMPCKQPPR